MTRNELGMREISEEEARKIGIYLSMVGICKKLRKLAKLDRLQLDETTHRSQLNLHLFKYIKYCGALICKAVTFNAKNKIINIIEAS